MILITAHFNNQQFLKREREKKKEKERKKTSNFILFNL